MLLIDILGQLYCTVTGLRYQKISRKPVQPCNNIYLANTKPYLLKVQRS